MERVRITALVITPMVTGCVSFLASLTIIIMIFRSNLKLSTIYRRLVFAISFFDLLQSSTQALSTIPMPAGTMLYATGNYFTCNLQGFLSVLGSSGSILYGFSLTVYFLLVVKFNVSEAKIKKYAEPALHSIPVLYSLIASIYIYATTQNFNPSGPVCSIASTKPSSCLDDLGIDCFNTRNPDLLLWISIVIPIFLVFTLNCIMLVMIWCAVNAQIQKSLTYRHSWVISSHDPADSTLGEETGNKWCCFDGKLRSTRSPAHGPLAARLSRPSRASVQRLKDIVSRGVVYIIGYALTYIFFTVYNMMLLYGSSKPPFAIIFLSRFTYPLQGLFNILVYTYPHVTTCHRNHNEYSWFRAFWEVIKVGGDSDRRTRNGGSFSCGNLLRSGGSIIKRRVSLGSVTSNRTGSTPDVDLNKITYQRTSASSTMSSGRDPPINRSLCPDVKKNDSVDYETLEAGLVLNTSGNDGIDKLVVQKQLLEENGTANYEEELETRSRKISNSDESLVSQQIDASKLGD